MIARTAAIGKAIARQITPSSAKSRTTDPVRTVPRTARPIVVPSGRGYLAL
jgi:hypothetical protein